MISLIFNQGGRSTWDANTRSRLSSFNDGTRNATEDFLRLAHSMLVGSEPADIGLLLRGYIYGVGSYSDPARFRLHEIIDEIGHNSGVLARNTSFFQHRWAVTSDTVGRFCPEMALSMYEMRPNTELEVLRVLEPCPNEAMDLRLPRPLGFMIHRTWRAPFEIYATDDAVAYIHPFQYQVLSRDRSAMWTSASPRSLSRCSVPDLAVEQIDMNIVIVRDRFEFFNLCHFLYDGITRILHYMDVFGNSKKDLFVFGSVPGEYHELICATLSEQTGIPRENLYFPRHAHLLSTTGRCFWFSDQVEVHAHPAQMAHPRSITALAALGASVPALRSTERAIYISRGDASRRRVANESHLIAALEDRGFISVQLGGMSASEQIGLFRGADVVIGPHGMGLTHIIMGSRLGRVIELFHPTAGTDAYAMVARTAGIEYDFVIGRERPDTPTDFEIDPERVLDLLGPEDSPPRRPSWTKAANMIPASRTFQGFFVAEPIISDLDGNQMVWGQQARRHHKKQGQTEVGRWPNILVCDGRTYTVSCWVLLPEAFSGSTVRLRVVGWVGLTQHGADLGQRDVWQRIYSTGSSPATGPCQVSLELEGDDDAEVFSTCWQFEKGSNPTAYVSTG